MPKNTCARRVKTPEEQTADRKNVEIRVMFRSRSRLLGGCHCYTTEENGDKGGNKLQSLRPYATRRPVL